MQGDATLQNCFFMLSAVQCCRLDGCALCCMVHYGHSKIVQNTLHRDALSDTCSEQLHPSSHKSIRSFSCRCCPSSVAANEASDQATWEIDAQVTARIVT